MKIRKITCLLMVFAMLLAMSAGCSGSGSEVTTISTVESSGATEPETTGSTEPQVTDPGATETTEPDTTEPDSSAATDPSGTEPTDPVATAPDAPADPTEDPQPTDPVPTEPPVTEPIPTEPAVTEPDPAPDHTHSYTQTVVAATCTAQGYTLNKCACGDSYKTNYTQTTGHSYGSYTANGDATCTKDGTKTAKCKTCGAKSTVTDPGTAKGHSYSSSVVKATCAAQGYTLHKCNRCGDSYKDNYTAAGKHNYVVTEDRKATINYEGRITYTCSGCSDVYYEYYGMSEEDEEAFIHEVEAATAKYINQFRVEQGDTEATILPGLTLVAEYRAVQLKANFRHSITDLREALAYYQYGEWVDMTEYGYDGYYTANAKEAIGRGGWIGTADEIGYQVASGLRNSSGHWAYVGSSDFPYLAVGLSYRGGEWFVCTLQTENNYG